MEEQTLKELIEAGTGRGLHPYRITSRWKNMEIVTENGRRYAVTKEGIYPKFCFNVDRELYQDYLDYQAGNYNILAKEYGYGKEGR